MAFITLPPIPIVVHSAFEMLAIAVGMQSYRRASQGIASSDHRFVFFAAAIIGAAIGCKVPGFFENLATIQKYWMTPQLWLSFLTTGKSIVGAILGAWVCIEIAKRIVGHQKPTGDAFAVALLYAIVIGRIGCFLAGLEDHTYGIESTLPWAVDFGDGIARHPLQLYEIIWLLLLRFLMRGWEKTAFFKLGDRFQLFVLGYFSYRFLAEYLKPQTMAYAGFSTIQVLSLLGLLATLPFCVRAISGILTKTSSSETVSGDRAP